MIAGELFFDSEKIYSAAFVEILSPFFTFIHMKRTGSRSDPVL